MMRGINFSAQQTKSLKVNVWNVQRRLLTKQINFGATRDSLTPVLYQLTHVHEHSPHVACSKSASPVAATGVHVRSPLTVLFLRLVSGSSTTPSHMYTVRCRRACQCCACVCTPPQRHGSVHDSPVRQLARNYRDRRVSTLQRAH